MKPSERLLCLWSCHSVPLVNSRQTFGKPQDKDLSTFMYLSAVPAVQPCPPMALSYSRTAVRLNNEHVLQMPKNLDSSILKDCVHGYLYVEENYLSK